MFDELLKRTTARHDHLCPRQVLGVRMGMLAAQILKLDLPQHGKRLLTMIETDGCFADGVAVATGCELGHRTLRLVDFGRVAATFIDTKTEQAIRIAPHASSRIWAHDYVEKDMSRWHIYLNAYQVMPNEALFTVQHVALRFSTRELMSIPSHRVNCAACGEEIINEREVVIDGRVLCRACAGEAYYTVNSEVTYAAETESGIHDLSPVILGEPQLK